MISGSADVQQLARQFVQTERASQDQVFSQKQSRYDNLLETYSNIKSKINDFRDVLNDMKYQDKLEEYSVKTSEDGLAKVTAGANASPGEYQINIEQLAKADKSALDFASETDPVSNSGTMTLGVGGDTFTVDMSTLPADATVVDLKDKINSHANNTGVEASLIRTDGSVKMLLSAKETGASNTLSMSTDGSAAMADIQSSMDSRTTVSTAQDAIVNMGDSGSLQLTSSSNNMKDVIDGLTIDLQQAHSNNTDQLTINVAQDNEATAETIQGFVDKFNAILGATTSSKSESTVSNDGTARMISRQLKSEISESEARKLGIEFSRTGQLSLDKDRLSDFLEQNPDGMTEIFAGDTGVVETMTSRLDSYVLGGDALLNSSSESIRNRDDQLQDRMDRFDRRMENRYNLYIDQFTEMKGIVQQLDSTQSLF